MHWAQALHEGMFAFGRRFVRCTSSKIIVSERGDEGEALDHQGYPAWEALSEWQDLLEHGRHGNVSNYLL